MEERTFPFQVYSLCTAAIYYYHSLNLIYDFCLTRHGVRRHFLVEFGSESGVLGVSPGELVLISTTLLREKLLVWK